MITFIPAYLYYPIFMVCISIITIYYSLTLSGKSNNELLNARYGMTGMWVFAIIFIVLVGLRPVNTHYFGDTVNYARNFNLYASGALAYDPNSGEWLFSKMMYECSKIMGASEFFLLVEIGYVLPLVLACKRIIKTRPGVALLFCFAAFSFFTYGTNGIRNGWACSLVVWAYSYFVNGSRKDKIIAIILFFCAYNVHHSTALPILCGLIAYYFVRDTRLAIGFWIASIFISLVASGFVESFFTSLGFDDRLEGYLTSDDGMYTKSYFRWDFLLYSSMPILLGWYAVVKKKVSDSCYSFLLNSYILCNSFWVMMIRASYSNRFAYLSWFLYPLVLAYPLLKLPIYKQQGRKLALIMMAHTGFTVFMWLIGK